MNNSVLARQLREQLLADRQHTTAAVRSFVNACAGGSAEEFFRSVSLLNATPDGWRLALMKVAQLPYVSEEIRTAFLAAWIKSKNIPSRVRSRPVLAGALPLFFRRNYSGKPIQLYRGARAVERTRRVYSFTWSVDREQAREFAKHWQVCGREAVLLQTIAPPEAILLDRQPGRDQGKVVVDPFRLARVLVAERL